MNAQFWRWLILSDEGLLWRILIGASIFTALALWDLRRNGRAATRWREYLFLLSVVILAMAYGIVNDQITCSISWEYFYNHDESMSQALGPLTFGQSPSPLALHIQAIRMGAKATWTPGLIIGVAFLIANNPRKSQLPRLPYRRLYRLLLVPLCTTAGLSIVLGLAGYMGLFTIIAEDFRFLPRQYLAVYGAHLGAYAGGFIGLVVAILRLLRLRKELARQMAA